MAAAGKAATEAHAGEETLAAAEEEEDDARGGVGSGFHVKVSGAAGRRLGFFRSRST